MSGAPPRPPTLERLRRLQLQGAPPPPPPPPPPAPAVRPGVSARARNFEIARREIESLLSDGRVSEAHRLLVLLRRATDEATAAAKARRTWCEGALFVLDWLGAARAAGRGGENTHRRPEIAT